MFYAVRYSVIILYSRVRGFPLSVITINVHIYIQYTSRKTDSIVYGGRLRKTNT